MLYVRLSILFASITLPFALSSGLLGQDLQSGDRESKIHQRIQYGKMHQVIGQQQHQGRVSLATLLEKPNLFAVGALAGLSGEITIVDGKPTLTGVSTDHHAKVLDAGTGKHQATMLIGAYVNAWKEIEIDRDLTDAQLDTFIESELKELGRDPKMATMFQVIGSFKSVDMHVINGACPVHARIRKLEIPLKNKPFEVTIDDLSGHVVGVFADGAAGKLTHPGTQTHKHLVYQTSTAGPKQTGHIESCSVAKGARLLLPKFK